MDIKSRRQRYYTFMVIPHDAHGRTFSVKIPARLVYFAVGAAVFTALLVTSSMVYSSHLSRKLFFYRNAIAKNQEQRIIIDSFAQKTDEMNQTIFELEEKDEELRKLLGLKSWNSKIKLSSGINRLKPKEKANVAHKQLNQARGELTERQKSFKELKTWVDTVRRRFASTPSCWPVYGKVMSYFGYRIFPWRGFHAGIDISRPYGTAVRVTADGIVAYVGWQTGYGKTVVIDHGHGISTLYGHLSKYLVRVGEKVKKGQVICHIGSTGYSTGPHLHYGVQKSGKPVNPMAYLDLNLLSASRIWR